MDPCPDPIRPLRLRLSRPQSTQVVSGIRAETIAQSRAVSSPIDSSDERSAMARFHLRSVEMGKRIGPQYEPTRRAGIIHPNDEHKISGKAGADISDCLAIGCSHRFD